METTDITATTKHQELVQYFQGLLNSGTYLPGDLFPTELSLARQLGVNRATIRKALHVLVASGHLTRRPGSGTVVARARADEVASADRSPARPEPVIGVLSSFDLSELDYRINPCGQIISAFEQALPRLLPGVRVLMFNQYPQLPSTDFWRQKLDESKLSGLMMMDFLQPPEELALLAESLLARSIPAVLCSSTRDVNPLNRVGFSQYDFGHLAAHHLIRLGHRRLIYALPDFTPDWLKERITGFQQALLAAGLEFTPANLVRHGDNIGVKRCEGRKFGAQMAQAVVATGCTGIVAVNDSYAAGLIEGLGHMGYRVPDSYSIIGADDNISARDLNITTISQSFSEMGAAAAELLAAKIGNTARPSRVERWLLRPPLIERITAATPRAD